MKYIFILYVFKENASKYSHPSFFSLQRKGNSYYVGDMFLFLNRIVMKTVNGMNEFHSDSSIRQQEMRMIGILSGSWPEAGIAITKEMHHYLQRTYKAVDDMDYPRLCLVQ